MLIRANQIRALQRRLASRLSDQIVETREQPIVIRSGQISALQTGLKASFQRKMATHLREDFAADLKKYGVADEDLESMVSDSINRAELWGLTREDHIILFLECTAILGPSFDTSNETASGILKASDRSVNERMTELNDYLLFGLGAPR